MNISVICEIRITFIVRKGHPDHHIIKCEYLNSVDNDKISNYQVFDYKTCLYGEDDIKPECVLFGSSFSTAWFTTTNIIPGPPYDPVAFYRS